MVFRAELAHVVVDVADRSVGFYSLYAHRFEEQKSGGACGVLGQCLVDFYADGLAFFEFAVNEVVFENFVCECFCQFFSPREGQQILFR